MAARGLELRVSAAGSKVWALRYRRNSDGTKRTHTLGSYPIMTLEEAREAAHECRRSVARGGNPAAEKRARSSRRPFQLADDWIELHGKLNKNGRALRDDRSQDRLHPQVH
jgi:hypothetical protein